jgi:hypothetical protein
MKRVLVVEDHCHRGGSRQFSIQIQVTSVILPVFPTTLLLPFQKSSSILPARFGGTGWRNGFPRWIVRDQRFKSLGRYGQHVQQMARSFVGSASNLGGSFVTD